jgi:hypothetical protein
LFMACFTFTFYLTVLFEAFVGLLLRISVVSSSREFLLSDHNIGNTHV